jgi:hypothetical protein
MIEYVDYLIITDHEKEKEQTGDIATPEQKKMILKYLWQLTKILEKSLKN